MIAQLIRKELARLETLARSKLKGVDYVTLSISTVRSDERQTFAYVSMKPGMGGDIDVYAPDTAEALNKLQAAIHDRASRQPTEAALREMLGA